MRRGPHKQILALIAGSGERTVMSAAAIVALVFVATGHGWGLLIAAWYASLFASGFMLVAFALALAAQAAGVADDDRPAPATAPAQKPAGTDTSH